MDTYEKKYKDANNKVAARFGTNVAKEIFTDLYESEDERMMHQLHSWMKEFGGAEEYTEKVYTWLKSLLEKQAQTFTKRDVDEAFVEGMAFAKNELEKQGEPTDNDMVEALRTEYEKGKADAFAEMQKEWSEEDERILDALITSLNNEIFTGRLETLKGIGVALVISWLKSLRSQNHWKPSDEQMEALYEEIQKSDRIRDDRIVLLYNDLKKLKGE